MYSSLLKRGSTNLQEEQTRVIDTNELVARRISELAEKMERPENVGFVEGSGEGSGSGEDGGFVSGLAAETVEGLLSDSDETEEGNPSNIIKANADNDAVLEKARAEAAQILEMARNQAQAQAEEIRSSMQESLAREREETLAKAREQGYEDGRQQAEREFAEKSKNLEREYQEILDQLEPQFIDTITGIYEHIFHVELSSYREILVYLISSTLRRAEGSRSFLVHVSREDYPYVSMQKKQICQDVIAPNCEMEIVEDITLGQNECMIETEGGIFDCGLGTQMAELNQKLKLLSYERA